MAVLDLFQKIRNGYDDTDKAIYSILYFALVFQLQKNYIVKMTI